MNIKEKIAGEISNISDEKILQYIYEFIVEFKKIIGENETGQRKGAL